MAMSSNLLTVSAPWKEKDVVFLMVSSYRPSENRHSNSPSALVKSVFSSRRYLTHTQDKGKNCSRHSHNNLGENVCIGRMSVFRDISWAREMSLLVESII